MAQNIDAKINLRRNAGQAQALGNTFPPNMVNKDENMLRMASPPGFSLLNTKIDKTPSDIAAASCRNYTDITGLRQLQKDQINRTHYEPACGWRYRPSSGFVPEINQAAVGSADGPIFGQAGSPDEVVGGTQWYWNLNDAERDISAKICQSASKCNQLNLLGRYAEICGYCKTSGATIPIQNGLARYPTDNSLGCLKDDIVTTTKGNCEGFTGSFGSAGSFGSSSFGSAGGARSLPANGRGDLNEAFQGSRSRGVGMGSEGFRGSMGSAQGFRGSSGLRGRSAVEGLIDFDILNNCTDSPLSRDCVVLAAKVVGCENEGTLITALNGAAAGSDYDSNLRTNPVYTTYKTVATPGITSATLKDGSVTLQTALDDFTSLKKNTQSQNQKLALSAQDLCLRKGAFDDYDFCSEMTPTTIINNNTIGCVEQLWLNNGGTTQGTGYPTLDSWSGKSYQQFINSMNSVVQTIRSSTKATNVAGLKKFFGTDTAGAAPTLPKNDNTRGAETVWFDFGTNYASLAPPVILRCEVKLSKEGEVVPFFTSAAQCASKYNFPTPNYKAYTSAFEIRSDIEQKMTFSVTTNDGFMLSVNQNPYEETVNRGNDWGSWKTQSATQYTSKEYPVDAEKSGKTNTVVTKWFNIDGESTSQTNIALGGTTWKKIADTEVYLTQEPLAPWLQYEVCTRPNNGKGNANGFFEKRFNGPIAFNNETNQSFPSFDVVASGVTIQTDPNMRKAVPKGLAYTTFTSSSSWKTMSYIHVNAMRTITILVRPTATQAVGQSVPLFYHSNDSTFKVACEISNNAGQYYLTCQGTSSGNNLINFSKGITMNEWNLVVLQYIGDENGLRKIHCNFETLARLQDPTIRGQFSSALTSVQTITRSLILAGRPGTNYKDSAGSFSLGNRGSAPGFTGDVAWVHAFRNFLDTDTLLQSEVEQKWISRWPRQNLDTDPVPKFI